MFPKTTLRAFLEAYIDTDEPMLIQMCREIFLRTGNELNGMLGFDEHDKFDISALYSGDDPVIKAKLEAKARPIRFRNILTSILGTTYNSAKLAVAEKEIKAFSPDLHDLSQAAVDGSADLAKFCGEDLSPTTQNILLDIADSAYSQGR